MRIWTNEYRFIMHRFDVANESAVFRKVLCSGKYCVWSCRVRYSVEGRRAIPYWNFESPARGIVRTLNYPHAELSAPYINAAGRTKILQTLFL